MPELSGKVISVLGSEQLGWPSESPPKSNLEIDGECRAILVEFRTEETPVFWEDVTAEEDFGS
jgi:hypothetical protein